MRRGRSIGALGTIAVALATLAGCGVGPVSTPFVLGYPASTAGADPMPISLIDQVGLVTAIAAAPGTTGSAGVEVAPGLSSALRVSWQGGPCDDRVTLVLNDIGGGRYELAIHNHPPITAGFSCDDSNVLRVVDITFNRHLDPQDLTLNVQYP